MKNKLEWMQLSQQQSGVILDEISNKINELNLGSKFAVWISQIPIELDDLAKYSEQLLEQGKSEEEINDEIEILNTNNWAVIVQDKETNTQILTHKFCADNNINITE